MISFDSIMYGFRFPNPGEDKMSKKSKKDKKSKVDGDTVLSGDTSKSLMEDKIPSPKSSGGSLGMGEILSELLRETSRLKVVGTSFRIVDPVNKKRAKLCLMFNITAQEARDLVTVKPDLVIKMNREDAYVLAENLGIQVMKDES